ncbi:MAG: tRNA(Met) cytidine acetyltransferase, partial [Methylophagaceae bacterium]
MNQRQCVILRGDSDWCRSSLQDLLANFDHNKLIFVSNNTHFSEQSIAQKQAKKYLGKEFDSVIFDARDAFNPDSFGAIVGTIKAGGALIVLLPTVLTNSLWLQRFNQIALAYSYSKQPFQIITQADVLPSLITPKPRLESSEYKPTVDQQAAFKGILNVVHGHRRRPLVLSSDRGRGKSAVLGMAAAELIKQGKKT